MSAELPSQRLHGSGDLTEVARQVEHLIGRGEVWDGNLDVELTAAEFYEAGVDDHVFVRHSHLMATVYARARELDGNEQKRRVRYDVARGHLAPRDHPERHVEDVGPLLLDGATRFMTQAS